MHLGTALTSGTTMTLDARFTQLRRGESLYQDAAGGCTGPLGAAGRSSRADAVSAASVRNRRLAVQMSRRPAVVAALNRGFSRNMSNGIMNRLGRGTVGDIEEVGTFRSSAAFAANSRRRSSSTSRIRTIGPTGGIASIGGRGGGGFRRGVGGGGNRRGGGRIGGNRSRPLVRSNSVSRIPRSGSLGRLSRAGSLGNLSRSGSVNRLTRSQSLQSLTGWANNAFRGRGIGRGRRRGRGRGGGVMRGFISRKRDSFGRRGRGVGGSPGNFRVVRGGRGGRNVISSTANIGTGRGGRNFRALRNNKFRGGRGSGGRGGAFRGNRGRGRGRGGGRGRQKGQVPTKEALDMEIDEYMSTTKSHLDKEIDNYMNQPAEETVVTANQQNGAVTTESWD